MQDGVAHTAQWRSERGATAPQRVVMANDTTTADEAYRHACAGTAMLWAGDFFNARQLLQAMARRCDAVPLRKRRKTALAAPMPVAGTAEAFHHHRQAQAQRARVLGMLLMPLGADYGMALRRAPDVRQACTHAWGLATPDTPPSVTSLRELLGLTSADEWRRVGVAVPALGAAPHNRIHPHYGVFSPARGEYVDLVAQAPLPPAAMQAGMAGAFDIGVGSGVLSAVLARRGVGHIVATDQDQRALACATANLAQLGVATQVTLLQTDLFPPGTAPLVVCNPPWLPARASSPVERAVYDEGSRMLKGFLAGLAAHLSPGGEGWLIMSDLAEHLGLRTRAELLGWVADAGLTVLGRLDTRPVHGKATKAADALHAARAAEVTSLWRLGVAAG
ncbi:MAG: class I SAM-dependent methyltransferase [Burkholderiales bacterium]|nr:class I SAM-dependent methyltransferase [Burkholderiales bacterium]